MTPREQAESTDPEVLRDILRRRCALMAPDTARAEIIRHGGAAALIALANGINDRTPKGVQIKHGLLD